MFPVRELLYRSVDVIGANRLAFRATHSQLRILCYHGAWLLNQPHFGDRLFIGAGTFRTRLNRLVKLQCNVLPLAEALEALRTGTLPDRAVAITIDDGWASTFDFMLPELQKLRYPATVYLQTEKLLGNIPVYDVAITFAVARAKPAIVELPASLLHRFVDADFIQRTYRLDCKEQRNTLVEVLNKLLEEAPDHCKADLLRHIFDLLGVEAGALSQFRLASERDVQVAASHGYEMALHTHTHSLGDFSGPIVRDEIRKNRAALGRMLGRPEEDFTSFCWPSGAYTESARDTLASLGITAATTCEYGLAKSDSDTLLLPRILDGERTSDPAFIASISGVRAWVRGVT